jgi:hypothetical protein
MTPEAGPAEPRQIVAMTAGSTPPDRASIARGLGAVVKIGGGSTTLVAVVSDVLVPLGWLTLGVAVLALLALVVCMLPAKWVDDRGRSWFKGYWRGAVVTSLAVSMVLSLIAFGITRSAPPGGWLGSQVPAVRDLQTQLGIITVQTAEIADNTRQINEKIDRLKQETSVDPRKELANIGVSWSTDAFVEALEASDARSVKLFLDGGMSPTVLHKGTSAVVYILQPRLPSPIPMLELMIKAGFDPNVNLVDGRIFAGYGLPPHFESADLPPEYAAWQDSFGGPALLWVVIRAAYAGPTASDLEVIKFLVDRGVDTKVTKQFLVAYKPIWGDTPAFQQVWHAVYRD